MHWWPFYVIVAGCLFDCGSVLDLLLVCPQQKCNSWASLPFSPCFWGTYSLRFSKRQQTKVHLFWFGWWQHWSPSPATYGHRAWLRAHKCYSPWTLCQPMAHRINGQFRAGGQACPQHYMAWVNRARRQRSTPHIQGHSQPGAPFLRKMSIKLLD